MALFLFLFCLRKHVIVLDVPIVLDVIVFDTGLLVLRILSLLSLLICCKNTTLLIKVMKDIISVKK